MKAEVTDQNVGVASSSPEAKDLAAHAMAQPARDLSKPISEIRRKTLEDCTPVSNAVIESTGVMITERVIDGVKCTVIRPPNPHPNRQVVYLFGGGFCLGSPFEDLPISAKLAVKTGAQVIAPQYPLAPEHPYPAALDACVTVMSAVLRKSPRACLCGESAGGNLALGLVHRLKASGDLLPRALALMSPAVDLDNPGDSGTAERDPFLRSSETIAFHTHYVSGSADPTDPGLSPIYGSFDEDFPPVFVTTGTRDLLLSGCVRLDRVMREAGADCTLRVWEGMWHVFEYYADIPEAEASLSDIADFLISHLRQ